MERLTNKAWQNFDPWECCGQDHYCQRGCNDPGGCTKGCIVPRLYARLGAYEDTDLTPEEIDMDHEAAEQLRQLCRGYDLGRLVNLAEADKDGRVVVLPCKVGDTVYFRTYDCNGTVDLGIQPHKVTAIVGHAIVRGGIPMSGCRRASME